MGHINFDKGTDKKKNWLGFTLALAVCLVAVGGVAIATYVNSTHGLEQEAEGNQAYSTTVTSPTKPVEQIVTDVPDKRTTKPKTSITPKATQPHTTKHAADLFILPLTNEVMREYSDGHPIYSKTMNDWRAHNGVDFKGKANQPVKALADGTIIAIEKDALWGSTVTIDHGYGIHSRYCGVTVSSLKVKDTVKVGSVIGKLSEVPCEAEDGPHLHLEILVNGEYVNPVEAIGRDVKTTPTSAAN